MSNKALEAWAWVLIYGGLLLVMLGFYIQNESGGGGILQLLGAAVAVPGVVMIVIRSRRPPHGD